MSKNIEHFSDISFFINNITGAYDSTKPDPLNPNAPSIPNVPVTPITPYSVNGVSYVDVPQSDGTVIKTLASDYKPPIPVDHNIYGDFTLRMYKLPADLTGNYIPLTSPGPDNKPIPIKFNQPMDNDTGAFTKNSFIIGLNTALSECIKFQDQCYAVVIPDPGQSSYYTYYLAQKPQSNNKSPNSDNEYFLCNQGYVSYIKNKNQNGNSNIMSSTISCDFTSNNKISYGGSGVSSNSNQDNSNTPLTLSPTAYLYLHANDGPKVKSQPPYLLYIGIGVVVLLIIGGIYYYYTQVANNEPVTSSIHTSKLLKKKGGYFFFV